MYAFVTVALASRADFVLVADGSNPFTYTEKTNQQPGCLCNERKAKCCCGCIEGMATA